VRRAERVLAGTGLFLGTGAALERAGPLSIFLAFTIVGMVFGSGAARRKDRSELTAAAAGTVVFAMVQSLGEIVTWLPISGGLTVYAYRYADPALGFAMGWNYALSAGVVLCAEISAASVRVLACDSTRSGSRLMTCRSS
jgi:amino acid transporter